MGTIPIPAQSTTPTCQGGRGVMLAPQLKQSELDGQYLKTVLFQHKVFCKDVGNPAAAPDRTLLLLHGFPESSFSFHKVVEGLAKLFDRVVLFDFPGYGLSDKPIANYTYSLFEQTDVALQVWKERGVTGGHVLSHDMGDSVHTELVARHVSGLLPAWLSAGFKSFTFTNGNMVLDLARLRLGQKALLGGRAAVQPPVRQLERLQPHRPERAGQ